MTQRTKDIQKTDHELRWFALVIGLACLCFAGALLWKGTGGAQYFLLVAGIVLFLGLFQPRLLVFFEKWWMILAHYMGTVMTYVIVALVFYLVITPMGLLLRVLGKDLLGLKRDKSRESYWVPMEKDGPGTRPYTPY